LIKEVELGITKEKNYVKNVTTIEGDIFKIEFYDEEKQIDLMMEFMKDLGLQLARMKPIHVEVTHEGVSKGEGLK